MDGFEVLRHLKSNPVTCNIPVVAVTANAMQRDIKRGLEEGFTAYLTKPLDMKKFLKTVDSCLGASNHKSEN
jgi:CheY-like chemotaxis protein